MRAGSWCVLVHAASGPLEIFVPSGDGDQEKVKVEGPRDAAEESR